MSSSIFRLFLWSLLVSSICPLVSSSSKSKSTSAAIDVTDQKDLKKLLRTKNNVIVGFLGRGSHGGTLDLLEQLGEAVRGQGTVATVNCESSEGKKLCKKLKVTPGSSVVLKHYKDGEYHLDYARPMRLQSLTTFMLDPTGEQPWEEDESAKDVEHLTDPAHFNRFFKKEKGGVLVMFYAPWCGFCKKMKNPYSLSASDVKGKAILAAMDASKSENNIISKKYNITGFPTLLYFEGGSMKYPYPGDNNRDAIVSFMNNPSPEAPEAAKKESAEVAWKDVPSEVRHLDTASFDELISQEQHVLVMFYAPWCGHCKRARPGFEIAAGKLKDLGVEGKLAAVDCTVEPDLAKRFSVTGYPTVIFFRSGSKAFDAGHVREAEEIVKFMQDPREPPPPPPPEKPWSEEESNVVHLGNDNFKSYLKKKKHALVMFYAPWCGHCKQSKNGFSTSADELKDNPQVAFCAVDCTVEKSLCTQHDVSGYPSFKYFRYFDQEPSRKYDGSRTKDDFVAFMQDPDNPKHLSGGSGPAPPPSVSPEEDWKQHEGAEHVLHLTDGTFDGILRKKAHALVAFYAPWCSHCKNLKEGYAGAALKLKDDDDLAMAAVDATVQTALGQKFDIEGYPTIKYFNSGTFVQDYKGGRRKMDFVEFLKKMAKSKDEL